MPYLRWTPQDTLTLKKMYDEGSSNDEIAKALGTSIRAVRTRCQTLQRNEVLSRDRPGTNSFWTPAVYAKLEQMWVHEGLPGSQCAAAIGCSRSAAMSAVRRMGWLRAPGTSRPAKGTKKEAFFVDPDKFVAEKYEAGSSIGDIANVTRTTAGRVRERLERMGYEIVKTPSYTQAVHPMWSMDEDARRQAFYEKFKAGWADVQDRLRA